MARGLALALLAGALAVPAVAHDPGLSSAAVVWTGGRLEAVLTFAADDLERVAPIAGGLLRVERDGAALSPERVVVVRGDGEGEVWLAWSELPEGTLELTAGGFARLPFGHQQSVRVTDGDGALLAARLLSARAPGLALLAR